MLLAATVDVTVSRYSHGYILCTSTLVSILMAVICNQ